ncbi:MAG: hypothetical protein JSR18_05645 [Proteobacteria bacterium]|nr:hypothetical protein [Pseudomonadota bacterium]
MTPSVPIALVREELARLADSEALRQAPTHRRLLGYLVEKRLAGDDSAFAETAIALEVFRRDAATFDPRTDPIVRVTAGRLRERLETHYAAARGARVAIRLPKGRYTPEFEVLGPAPERHGVAVLGTRNATGDPAFDVITAAFADHLADRLARAGIPRVMARTSVAAAQAQGGADVADRLNVEWLVDSTLAREGDGAVRLTVRLVHATDGAIRGSDTTSGRADDAYRLVDRMLDAAVLRMHELVPGASAQGATATLPPAARAALDAIRLMLLQRTLAGTDEALRLAEALTAAHPAAADGWGSLAAALYSRLAFMDRDHVALGERITHAADRALALDPEQPVALRTKAILASRRDYQPNTGEALFERVLRTSPHYTSARLNYAELLAVRGRAQDARAQLKLAEVYDPLSVTLHLARATCLGLLREYEEARDAWTLCRAGGESSLWLLQGSAENEIERGDFAAADALLREGEARFPQLASTWLARAQWHAAQGDAAAARANEARCIDAPRVATAMRGVLAARLREDARALDLLEGSYRERDLWLLTALVSPALDHLVGEPRFDALCSACGVRAAGAAR